MISAQAFARIARKLGVTVPTVTTVYKVEARGNGYLPDGQVKILFEGHIFWKELKKRGIDPARHVAGNEDILFRTWDPKAHPYGKDSEQHARLQRAVLINRDAALSAASWGAFQILGANFREAGCQTLQEFVTCMIQGGEEKHLELFANYIISCGLDDELQARDWPAFARGYNGPLYWKHDYHGKLSRTYAKEILLYPNLKAVA